MASPISLQDFVTIATRHVRDDNNSIVFFLGAGCSRAAGIPLANGLMTQWEKDGISRSTYSTMMEERYPILDARNQTFRTLCNGKQPTAGHHALAQMFANFPRQIRLCLTTNFDGLVESAIDQRNHADGNQRHMRMHHQHNEGTATTLRQHLGQDNVFSVVKLHGDALSNTHNTHEELDALPSILVEPVRTEFQKKATMLVFIGYSGNDNGVVGWLEKINVGVRGCVYWCSQDEPAGLISPWLRLKHYKRVAHLDFDEIMTALVTRLLPQQPPQPPQQQLMPPPPQQNQQPQQPQQHAQPSMQPQRAGQHTPVVLRNKTDRMNTAGLGGCNS